MHKLATALWYALSTPFLHWWGWLYLFALSFCFLFEFLAVLLVYAGWVLLFLGGLYALWATWTSYFHQEAPETQE